MIGDRVDNVIYGQNYFSYVKAFFLLNKGEEVLLLNDDRVNLSHFDRRHIHEIDRLFLKAIGERLGNPVLINIDDHLKKDGVVVFTDNTCVHLGSSPSKNFRELTRRYYDAFHLSKTLEMSTEQFDNDFNSFCSLIASLFASGEAEKKLDSEFLPWWAKELLTTLKAELFDNENSTNSSFEFRSFIAAYRSLLHGKISLHFSELELLHLLLSLISPTYEIKDCDLENALQNELEKLGGHYRKLRISDWSLEGDKPWVINLSSYEGAVMPKTQYFFGDLDKQFLFEVLANSKKYIGIEVELTLKDEARDIITYKTGLSAHHGDFGGVMPFMFYKLKNNKMNITIPYRELDALKLDFIKVEVIDFITKSLAKNFAFKKEYIEDAHFSYAQMILLDQLEKCKFNEATETLLFSLQNTEVGNEISLSNDALKYYGSFKNYKLGKVSRLIDAVRMKGQAAVEYILLVAAISGIIFSLMGQLRTHLIADAKNCTPESKSLACQMKKVMTLDNFRRFRVMR